MGKVCIVGHFAPVKDRLGAARQVVPGAAHEWSALDVVSPARRIGRMDETCGPHFKVLGPDADPVRVDQFQDLGAIFGFTHGDALPQQAGREVMSGYAIRQC
ncbi:hypothetical protein D3C87_1881380 [compost metagenome]